MVREPLETALAASPLSVFSKQALPFSMPEISGIKPSNKDLLKLAKGLNYDLLLKWGDSISERDYFGFNNDFTAFIPLNGNKDDGLLWVNHEYVDPFFIAVEHQATERNREQMNRERYNVGGSIVRIQKNKSGKWKIMKNDPLNRRVTGMTEIPFNWPEPIRGSNKAIGTLANCSGGNHPLGNYSNLRRKLRSVLR